MRFKCLCNSLIIALILTAATATASDSSKAIIEASRAMEQERNVTVTSHFELVENLRKTQQIPPTDTFIVSAVSPDGEAVAWSGYSFPRPDNKAPFLMVKKSQAVAEAIHLEGRIAIASAVSSKADLIVAVAVRTLPLSNAGRELLAIDRRSGFVIHDLTPYVPHSWLSNDLRDVRVSGSGDLVALGTDEQINVLEIPSGKKIYSGPGSSPRLSPDGKRLAFVNNGAISIVTLANGAAVQVMRGKRVKGIGSWSPDGRFLIAGAWTTLVALEKRQVIIDTTTSQYAVVGKIGDGDYGSNLAWVSVNLLQ